MAVTLEPPLVQPNESSGFLKTEFGGQYVDHFMIP